MDTKISAVIRDLFGVEVPIVVTRPDPQFGDFATNVALQLAPRLNKNPREVAGQIAEKLRENKEFSEVSVAGPGFINLKLTDQALIAAVSAKPGRSLEDKTVLVEYSDPNAFKPLHAGHLYTTLTGDVISRIIEQAGARTVRLNYWADVGLQAGKSMWGIIRRLGGENPEKLSEVSAQERAAWLGARYVEGHTAYEDDEESKREITDCNKRVYQVHAENDHESPFAQIYWTTREWSYDSFKALYEQLDVRPFDRYIPESNVAPVGLQVVREQLQKGIYEESDGAVVYDGEKVGLHTRVFINSAGLPTYEAKDVGLSLTKWQDYHFDQSIIITASEQAQYMQVVIASIKQFAPEPAERTRHLTHGVVKLAGGKKMSSRKGNVVTAHDILEAARQAAAETEHGATESTVLAAVKYAFMKNRIGGDIVYDPKESVALEGNSGPYLQYAHARARSILAKSQQAPSEPADLSAGERALLRKLTEYRDVVEKATAELLPHYIATYLYELAQEFNSFYEHNRVIGDDRQTARLWLVGRYADTLKSGLGLLGIDAPDKM